MSPTYYRYRYGLRRAESNEMHALYLREQELAEWWGNVADAYAALMHSEARKYFGYNLRREQMTDTFRAHNAKTPR